MKKSRFTDSQIVSILQKQDGSRSVNEICQKYSISSSTFFKWKCRYSDVTLMAARQLKKLSEENVRLKTMLADAMLDNGVLMDQRRKK